MLAYALRDLSILGPDKAAELNVDDVSRRKANISPIFKKGDKTYAANYRLILLTSR